MQFSQLAVIATALASTVAAVPSGKWFDRYIMVILENEDINPILKNSIFKRYADQGILQNNYHAVAHPSQPNYYATIAGNWKFDQSVVANKTVSAAINGTSGDNDFDIPNQTVITSLLKEAGVSFKVYQENYPVKGACWLGSGYGDVAFDATNNTLLNPNSQGEKDKNNANRLYKRKHNPFLSFPTFATDADSCKQVTNFDDLAADIKAGTLPQYAYIVPNQLNDEHDTTVDFSADWFDGFMKTLLASPGLDADRTLVHVVYDEDDMAYSIYYNSPLDNAGQPNPYYNKSATAPPKGCEDLNACTLATNQVYSVLIGSAVKNCAGHVDNTLYNHYSILSTLEQNWNLYANLGQHDVDATPFDTTCPYSGGETTSTDSSNGYTDSASAPAYTASAPAYNTAKNNQSVLYSGAEKVVGASLAAIVGAVVAFFF
ncbi:hypothetical protein HDU76_006940 [Blyttiomyces sp. JEL0837]|nr:hypothetical protein HDU76_006940 [Blyttiomyces sp. JEL0837]